MTVRKQYDIIILDSGVDVSHPSIKNFTDIDCALFDSISETLIPITGDISGHATALADLIKQNIPDASILSICIFEIKDGKLIGNEEIFLKVLDYIYNNLSVKVINMSFGIEEPTQIKQLKNLTKKLADNNVILVSAFDNTGGITFPAALESVIGVSMVSDRPLVLPFACREDSIINLSSSPNMLHVAWKNGTYKNTRGSSFSCAVVSADALQFIRDGCVGLSEVLKAFKEKYPPLLEENIDTAEKTRNEKPTFKIGKAVVFPFNKEMHSVVRYADDLIFDLVDVYDIKYTFQVGMTTNEVLKHEYKNNYTIKNIDRIDWNSFDTIIMGSTIPIMRLFRRSDWIKKFVEALIEHKKNIFSFERLPFFPEKSNNIYYPSVKPENIPTKRDGRLFRTAVPIISVLGTQSKQGKFTIQMLLRQEFKKLDCNIGQIGTEPNSLLFGMDFVFANGLNPDIEIPDYEQVLYLNDLLRRTCEKCPDIIITGSQKGVVPPIFNSMNHYSRQNYVFIDAIKPDYAIVTVSVTDSVEYIKRTIDFLSALSLTKTLALVLFPVTTIDENYEEESKSRVLSIEEYEAFRDKVNAEIDIPVLFLDDDDLGNKLMKIILNKIS